MTTIWKRCDKDGNGSLDRDEVLDVLLQMGYTKSQIDLDVTMAEIDEDGNGEVDFDEFRNWFFIQDATAQESMVVVYYQDTDGSQAETSLACVLQLALFFLLSISTPSGVLGSAFRCGFTAVCAVPSILLSQRGALRAPLQPQSAAAPALVRRCHRDHQDLDGRKKRPTIC